ncbi:hypothetical protein GCM10010406_52900 [Streptomyces thermolineatus]|uniref:Minor tail protein n=1 Tax=Streptomyces thermolineatus TaxID=44033 RepID=A0ABP6A7T5_9ACTN
MADPIWVDNLTTDGRKLRRADLMLAMAGSTSLSARSGVRPGPGGLEVSVSGGTITVTAGVCAVYQPNHGLYRAALTASWTAALTPADSALTRKDLVYLRIWDTSVDSSGLSAADPVYLAGTPSSTPATPTVPSGEIGMVLGEITVPPVGGGSPSVNTSVRPVTVAPGGILPGQTTTPAGAYTGMYWDNGTTLCRWNGSAVETFQKVSSTAWTTAQLSPGYIQGNAVGASPSYGNGSGPIRYRRVLRDGTWWMEWDGGANRANGAPTDNILAFALTSTYRPAYRHPRVVARNATNITGVANSTSVVHTVKVDFNPDGTVALVSANAGSTETNWFSLSGVSYPLA